MPSPNITASWMSNLPELSNNSVVNFVTAIDYRNIPNNLYQSVSNNVVAIAASLPWRDMGLVAAGTFVGGLTVGAYFQRHLTKQAKEQQKEEASVSQETASISSEDETAEKQPALEVAKDSAKPVAKSKAAKPAEATPVVPEKSRFLGFSWGSKKSPAPTSVIGSAVTVEVSNVKEEVKKASARSKSPRKSPRAAASTAR